MLRPGDLEEAQVSLGLHRALDNNAKRPTLAELKLTGNENFSDALDAEVAKYIKSAKDTYFGELRARLGKDSVGSARALLDLAAATPELTRTREDVEEILRPETHRPAQVKPEGAHRDGLDKLLDGLNLSETQRRDARTVYEKLGYESDGKRRKTPARRQH